MLNLLLAASAVLPKVLFFHDAEVGDLVLYVFIDDVEGERIGVRSGTHEVAVMGSLSHSGVSVHVADRLCRFRSTRDILLGIGGGRPS